MAYQPGEHITICVRLADAEEERLLMCKKTNDWCEELKVAITVPGTYAHCIERIRSIWKIQQPAENLALTTFTFGMYTNKEELGTDQHGFRKLKGTKYVISSECEWQAFWTTHQVRLESGTDQKAETFTVMVRPKLPDQFLLPKAVDEAKGTTRDEETGDSRPEDVTDGDKVQDLTTEEEGSEGEVLEHEEANME